MGKGSRFVQVAHVSLDLQHQVPVRHSVHLWIPDVHRRDNGSLKLLTRASASRHPTSVYGQPPYLLAYPSTSIEVCSGLNPYARTYYISSNTSQGRPIEKTIIQPSVGASSSSSSGEAPDRDSVEDYPEIGGGACWNPAIEVRHINMVGPARGDSHNSSSKYQTISGSKASNAWTPSNNIVQNLNSDFNTVRLQTIIESIQQMVPSDSLLIALSQQGVEVVGNIVAAAPATENHRGEPSGGNRSHNRAKRAQSEAATSASGNKHLADNDVCWWIMQNRR
jgi:hypothetical protein